MDVHRLLTAPWAVFVLLSLGLGALAVACGPTATPTPTDIPPDPFAVVRATSQAAYQQGKAALDQGDLLRGCPAIDTAKTTDPDNNPNIQGALSQCLTQIPQFLATAGAANTPTPGQRTIVVATLPIVPAGQPTPPPGASQSNPNSAALVATQAASAATQAAAAGVAAPAVATQAASAIAQGATAVATLRPAAPAPAAATPSPGGAASASMSTFRDPQGRFSVAAPGDWTPVDPPQPAFAVGTPVVEYHDPNGRAEFDVAVDTTTKAVSPELYAASMEIAMQQQVPGYASEQVQPGSTAGQPSIRRVFTFTQRDAAGRDLQARGLQVVVLKGSTPYILAGFAPAEQFQQFSPTFDQMVDSFRFS